ncbi:hypothetical protein C8A00DRAFT_15585 [Chaetomidium leptoderma]|uniref:Uncharacterized protein n=1 Tax=Chaetomidium leptoderma TaxID=669021 RepID=A0AAN6ZWX4_9PEZI|nr:hypothetical protein C8A00DRAFT_15585 [Chaetomidium leptoderma]
MDIDIDPNVKDERVIRAQLLSQELAQHTTIEIFALDCASIWDSWVSLLSQTTFPLETSSRDSRFTLAFQAIETVISTAHGILQWLAYTQLIRLFNTLRETIRKERTYGIYSRTRGISDNSIAITIYRNALEGKLQRCTILERRRIGKRWMLLSKPSPLLLLLYSTYTETIVYV